MKLTGKAKEDFEKWLLDRLKTKAQDFYDLYFSMKWGVYVDFFDSIGINIVVEVWVGEYSDEVEYQWYIFSKYGAAECEEDIKTRSEARKMSIEKANEIYNSYD